MNTDNYQLLLIYLTIKIMKLELTSLSVQSRFKNSYILLLSHLSVITPAQAELGLASSCVSPGSAIF